MQGRASLPLRPLRCSAPTLRCCIAVVHHHMQAAAAARTQVTMQPMPSGGQGRVHRSYHHYRRHSRHRSSGARQLSRSRSRSQSRNHSRHRRRHRSPSRVHTTPPHVPPKDRHGAIRGCGDVRPAHGTSSHNLPITVGDSVAKAVQGAIRSASARFPGNSHAAATPDCSVCGSPCPAPRAVSGLRGSAGPAESGPERAASTKPVDHGTRASLSLPAGAHAVAPVRWFGSDIDAGATFHSAARRTGPGAGSGVGAADHHGKLQWDASSALERGLHAAHNGGLAHTNVEAALLADGALDMCGGTQLRWADLERLGPATSGRAGNVTDSIDNSQPFPGGNAGARRQPSNTSRSNADRHARRRRRVEHARQLARELNARIESQERRLQGVLAAASSSRHSPRLRAASGIVAGGAVSSSELVP